MADYASMRLKAAGNPEKLEEILQLQCRDKCQKKLKDTFEKCPDFQFPSLSLAEMATSDMAAAYHASLIKPGESVLDMTCGLGIDSFAFAAEASQVTSMELEARATSIAQANARRLGLTNIVIENHDSLDFLSQSNKTFDVIFCDPARRDESGRHYRLEDCSPNVVRALPLIMSHCKRLIIKVSPMLDIGQARRELGQNCDVTVVGTRKECKELILSLPGTGITQAVTLDQPAKQIFQAGTLLVPYPAVMKSAQFEAITCSYDLKKLHPFTHVFFANDVVANFPGEGYEILEIMPFNKATVRGFKARYPEINVSVRNFPLSAPELVKKLKIKEGGMLYLFGLTMADDQRKLFITHRL